MPDFQKALQSLKADDLAFLRQIASAPAVLAESRRKRRAKRTSQDASPAVTPPPTLDDEKSAPTNPKATSLPDQTGQDVSKRNATGTEAVMPATPGRRAPGGDTTGPDTAGSNTPVTTGPATASISDTTIPEAASAYPGAAEDASAGKVRTRRAVSHDWPPTGTVLTATYFGVTYRAQVVDAKKRLKSGKQLRLLDGPAQGKRLDSFSKAMLVATAKQRREQKLGRRGASSGWAFWFESTPPNATSPSQRQA